MPSTICKLKELRALTFMYSSIPECFGELEKLTFLSLRGTNIVNLPESFSNLKNLRKLWLHSCSNIVIPKDVWGLDLSKLYVPKHYDDFEFDMTEVVKYSFGDSEYETTNVIKSTDNFHDDISCDFYDNSSLLE
jgi:hypothetical protein